MPVRKLRRQGRGRASYAGVVKAAEEHQYASEPSARSEAWLAHESPAFRDGYLKASTLIGTVAAGPPFRLALPAPDR